MKVIRSAPLFAGLLLVLAGCATGTHYVPATGPGAQGYSEQQLEADRYSVSFTTGDNGTPALAGDYALLRAAESTLAHGGAWFRVTNRSGDVAPSRAPSFSFGVGGGSFGRGGGVGGGVGSTTAPSGARFTSTIEFVVGRGARPADPQAYDATEVADRLRARLPAG